MTIRGATTVRVLSNSGVPHTHRAPAVVNAAVVKTGGVGSTKSIGNRQAGDGDVEVGRDMEDCESRCDGVGAALDGQQIRAGAVDRQILTNQQLTVVERNRITIRQR